MLKVKVLGQEYFNEETNEFFTVNDFVLELEHSLVSLSIWEGIHKKPFLSNESKTHEETYSYIRCMTLNEDISDDIYNRLTDENLKSITDYINLTMTATWFTEVPGAPKKPPPRQVITAEIFYSWMVALNIPFECQHWHLSRLFTLIRVCSEQQAPKKKMSKAEIASRNRSLNEARKAQLKTSG